MNQFKTLLAQFLLVTSLLLPWGTTGAIDTFEQAGIISDVGYEQFTVNRKQYRIAPGARLKSSDASRNKFSDFKKGDEVYFKGKILNGVRYVDIIVYLTPVPS